MDFNIEYAKNREREPLISGKIWKKEAGREIPEVNKAGNDAVKEESSRCAERTDYLDSSFFRV